MDRQAIDAGIEKRWYVWQCASEPDTERYVAGRDVKAPCGHWQQTATRKYNLSERQKEKGSGWQGKCRNCGRRRQLNRGNTLPEHGFFEGRESAQAVADEMNSQEEHRQAIASQHEARRASGKEVLM